MVENLFFCLHAHLNSSAQWNIIERQTPSFHFTHSLRTVNNMNWVLLFVEYERAMRKKKPIFSLHSRTYLKTRSFGQKDNNNTKTYIPYNY